MRAGLGWLAGSAAIVLAVTSAEAAKLEFRGAWSAGASYAVGDTVTSGNALYIARAANRNAAPSPASRVWTLAGRSGMDWRGAWTAAARYATGAVVRFDGQTFVSLIDANQNRSPATEAAAWALLGGASGTVASGAGAPPAAQGAVGDYWIDTAAQRVYGPKTASGWPGAATSLVGPQGPTGENGARGATGAVGLIGETGPRGLRGPTGPVGAQGPQGITGAVGPQGPQGAQGPVGPTGPAFAAFNADFTAVYADFSKPSGLVSASYEFPTAFAVGSRALVFLTATLAPNSGGSCKLEAMRFSTVIGSINVAQGTTATTTSGAFLGTGLSGDYWTLRISASDPQDDCRFSRATMQIVPN